MLIMKQMMLVVMLLAVAVTAYAGYPDRGREAKNKGKRLTVKEWKNTPDGKNRWVDHIEIYDAEGRLVEEAEYGDYGRHLSWRSEYFYNADGLLEREVIYNERNKVSKVRKYEYNADGVCVRRLNYNANGMLNSYRDFEFIYE